MAPHSYCNIQTKYLLALLYSNYIFCSIRFVHSFTHIHSYIHLFICSLVRSNEQTKIHSFSSLPFYHSCAYSPVIKMSLCTTKTIDLCTPRRQRSARASIQSDQRCHCLHEEILGPELPTEHKVEALIRLCGCSSKLLLDAYDILFLFCFFVLRLRLLTCIYNKRKNL